MARISSKINPSTQDPKIFTLLSWVFMFLMGVGVVSLVVIGMASGKRKVTAKRQKGESSSRAREIEEEEEDVEQGRAANWVQNMPDRGFKSKRQVDMPSINIERFGLQHIERRGNRSEKDVPKGPNNPRRNPEVFEYMWHIGNPSPSLKRSSQSMKGRLEALEDRKKEEKSQN